MNGAFPIAWRENGAGEAVVFLHGVGGGSDQWAPQLASFGNDFRAIAWDMPGYGGSRPLEKVTFPALADALARFLDHLGLDAPHIVGHSIGGMVAQEFIAKHPDRAQTLTLSATSPAFGNPDGDFQREFVAARLAPLDEGRTMAEIAADVIPTLVDIRAEWDGVARAIDCFSRVPPETFRAMIRCIVTFDRRDNLGRIRVPTFLISGESDTNAPPAMMEKMASRIPGARYACLGGTGHLANLEQPAAFDSAVLGFILSVHATA